MARPHVEVGMLGVWALMATLGVSDRREDPARLPPIPSRPAPGANAYSEPMAEPVSEYEVRAPHPRLRPFVSKYTGYRQTGFEPGVHAGLPSKSLTFIVAFDDPLDVSTTADDSDRQTYWGMLGGLHAAPALVRHTGRQHGVQLAITPRGSGALFRTPAGELGSTVLHLDQVVPAFADELIDRLSAAVSWRSRWAVLDEVLLRAVRHDLEIPVELEHAWSLLVGSHGAVPVEAVAAEVGWSRRHFSQKFRENFGLAPKVMGRVLRFERAQQLLRLPTQPSLASVAAACGYADQAHMTREWHEFAGSSPTSWMSDETIPFVQAIDTESE